MMNYIASLPTIRRCLAICRRSGSNAWGGHLLANQIALALYSPSYNCLSSKHGDKALPHFAMRVWSKSGTFRSA